MANKQKTPSKKLKLWLVGGGTGGHVVPLLAVAEVLQRNPRVMITFVGDVTERDRSFIRAQGIKFIRIPTGKLRRYLTVSAIVLNIRDSWRIVWGIIQSYRLIRSEKPALIFTKGGPAALPVALAARITRTPVVIHESDSVMGWANRFTASFAASILTAFPAQFYPAALARKITFVGLPLRSEFCTKHHKPHPHPHRPMVLITGGSQGSTAINALVLAILPQLLEHASVMHITGDISYQQCLAAKDALPEHLGQHYAVANYTTNMAEYMKEAHVVVSRGSSTIFELASLECVMLIIPLPNAANNHQVKNAEIFVEHQAALMLRQENLTPPQFYETIRSLLTDQKLRSELKEGTRHFRSCDAARVVAESLKDTAEHTL